MAQPIEPTPGVDDRFNLLVYTLRVRAPKLWDDEMSTAAATTLHDAMETALQAVTAYINTLHPDIELVVEE